MSDAAPPRVPEPRPAPEPLHPERRGLLERLRALGGAHSKLLDSALALAIGTAILYVVGVANVNGYLNTLGLVGIFFDPQVYVLEAGFFLIDYLFLAALVYLLAMAWPPTRPLAWNVVALAVLAYATWQFATLTLITLAALRMQGGSLGTFALAVVTVFAIYGGSLVGVARLTRAQKPLQRVLSERLAAAETPRFVAMTTLSLLAVMMLAYATGIQEARPLLTPNAEGPTTLHFQAPSLLEGKGLFLLFDHDGSLYLLQPARPDEGVPLQVYIVPKGAIQDATIGSPEPVAALGGAADAGGG